MTQVIEKRVTSALVRNTFFSRGLTVGHLVKSLFLAIFLALASVASGQQRGTDYQLQLINDTFHRRLESTYKYREAAVPAGCTSVERHLQLGNKKYLMEYALHDRTAGLDMREDYSWRFINSDTVRVGMAHYVAGGKLTTGIGQASSASSSEFLNGMYFEVKNLLINQNFDPLAVLSLCPDTARSRQWLYAWSTQPAERGDTVASYHLFRSRTGDTCRLQLRERSAEQQLRRYGQRAPWRYAQRGACSWVVELTRRRLTAEIFPSGEGGQVLRWVRTYRTAADFTETLTGDYTIGHGGPPYTETNVLYSRDFTQINPGESIDKFTVFDSNSGTKAVLTFSIVSTYR